MWGTWNQGIEGHSKQGRVLSMYQFAGHRGELYFAAAIFLFVFLAKYGRRNHESRLASSFVANNKYVEIDTSDKSLSEWQL